MADPSFYDTLPSIVEDSKRWREFPPVFPPEPEITLSPGEGIMELGQQQKRSPITGPQLKEYILREYGVEVPDFAILKAITPFIIREDEFGEPVYTSETDITEAARVAMETDYGARKELFSPEGQRRFPFANTPEVQALAEQEMDLPPGTYNRAPYPSPGADITKREGEIIDYGLNQGGPVMPGLGFRPLGYFKGGAADLIVQFNNLFSQNKIGEVVDLVNNNQEVFFSGDKISPGLHPNVAAIINNLINLDYLTPPPIAEEISDLGGITTSDMLQLPLGGYELTGPTDEVFPSSYLNPQSLGEQRFRENMGDITYGGEVSAPSPYVGPGLGGEETPVDITNTLGQLYSPQGGSIIPQFQTGGYADNSHGTVAGKPGRRRRLPVREEEKEKETKHTDYKKPDWYARMLQSPTLGKVRIA